MLERFCIDSHSLVISTIAFELRHEKKQQNECVPSEDSDQPEHPPSRIRVFDVLSLGS